MPDTLYVYVIGDVAYGWGAPPLCAALDRRVVEHQPRLRSVDAEILPCTERLKRALMSPCAPWPCPIAVRDGVADVP